LPAADFALLLARLRQFHLPTSLSGDVADAAIFDSLAHDKKFAAGQIRFVLSSSLGSAFLADAGQVTPEDLRGAVAELRRPV
jgi:3-dehydroquinate synthetase